MLLTMMWRAPTFLLAWDWGLVLPLWLFSSVCWPNSSSVSSISINYLHYFLFTLHSASACVNNFSILSSGLGAVYSGSVLNLPCSSMQYMFFCLSQLVSLYPFKLMYGFLSLKLSSNPPLCVDSCVLR